MKIEMYDENVSKVYNSLNIINYVIYNNIIT